MRTQNTLAPLFRAPQARLYALAALALFLTSLSFVAAQVPALSLFRLPVAENTVFYALLAIEGIMAAAAVSFFTPFSSWKRQLGILLAIALPAVIVIGYGLAVSGNFHLLFWIGVGAYLILAGSLLSAHAIDSLGQRPAQGDSFRAWWRKQGPAALLAVACLTLIFFSFGYHRLGKYAAVDEPLWLYGRIGAYWRNIHDGELFKTDVSDKPGITVSILSGAGLLRYDPDDFEDKRVNGEVFSQSGLEQFFIAFRLPLLLAATLLLPLFYFFLERLVGRPGALLSYAFLATSPVLIGVSKIINPDALLWLFVPLSLLSFLVFQNKGAYRYLFLSGVFLGLGLLTKYIANILFVYLLGLLFLHYLYRGRTAALSFATYLKTALIHFAMLVFAAMATFYLLLPATWVDPEELWMATLGSEAFIKVAPLFITLLVAVLVDQWANRSRVSEAILALLGRLRHVLGRLISGAFLAALVFVIVDVWAGMRPFDFMELLGSPKTIATRSGFLGAFLTNFYPLAFAIPPLTLLGLLLLPVFLLRQRSYASQSLRASLYLIAFILLYYLGATINSVGSIVRYQIIIFPLAAILAGLGLLHAARRLERRFRWPRNASVYALTALVALVGSSALLQTPFPQSYASSLLPERYYVDLKDMGPGSYEIAQALNALPDAEKLLIWTDKDGVCQFFAGRCKRGTGRETIQDDSYDYIVVSSARETRTTNMFQSRIDKNPETLPVPGYYRRDDPAFAVYVNGRPSHYVRAFRYEGKRANPADQLPPAPAGSSREEDAREEEQ